MPGSVSITMGRGAGDEGRVASDTGYRLGSLNLLCNSGTQRSELLRSAEPEDPLDDTAVAVEQHGIRQPTVVVDLLHPPAPHEDRERRPEFPHECEHLAEIDVIRDRGDGEGAARELAVQLRHVG